MLSHLELVGVRSVLSVPSKLLLLERSTPCVEQPAAPAALSALNLLKKFCYIALNHVRLH